MTADPVTRLTFTCPVIRCVTGTGLTELVAPQPVTRRMAPVFGAAVANGSVGTSVTAVANRPNATSVRGACRTSTTSITYPDVPDRSVRPIVAVVGYGVGPLTGFPLTS